MTCLLQILSTGLGIVAVIDFPLHFASTENSSAFRSELWLMEYRKDDGDDEGSHSSDQETGVTTKERQSKPGDSRKTRDIPVPEAPGELSAELLAQQTPVAEWQVQEHTEDPYGNGIHVPNAWQLSQASGFRSDSRNSTVKGPTATTFAVAIVACIVVTGALYSGRE